MDAQSELQCRWWYRLLRVILLPLYALVLVVTLWLIYDGYHPRKLVDEGRSLIVCDNGEAYPASGPDYFLDVGAQLSGPDAGTAKNLCAYGTAQAPSEGTVTVVMPDGGNIMGVPHPGVDGPHLMLRYRKYHGGRLAKNVINAFPESKNGKRVLEFAQLFNFNVKVAWTTEGGWTVAFLYMAVAWILIHVAFVTARGAVLYVAVGRFLPKAGLRGWLTL